MHPAREICCSKGQRLSGRKVVLCVTGSIAAVEAVKLARELIRHGADVHPVMSEAAQRIIHRDALHFACGREPITSIDGRVQHVDLCGEVEDRADLLVISPATANTISKVACGIDDTPVTTMATTAIGSGVPIIIAPAMHISMYNHPVVRENIEKLKAIGVAFVDPVLWRTKAKLASTSDIVDHAIRAAGGRRLSGKRALVISGSTEQAIDQMRVVTNRSSGRTGVELAKALFYEGADVEAIVGARSAPMPSYVGTTTFTSVDSLIAQLDKLEYDVVLVPAAISDYTPAEPSEGKIPSGQERLVIEMRRTPKVIDHIRGVSGAFLVAFKAEHGLERDELIARARRMLETGRADAVVANDLRDVRESETRAILVLKDGSEEISGTKAELAGSIVSTIAGRLG